MKSLILLFIFASGWAQTEEPLDLRLPSNNEIKSFMKQAIGKTEKITGRRGPGCDIDYSPVQAINLERDYVCFVPEKNFAAWLIQPNDKKISEAEQSNDANPLNLKNQNKPGARLSDDVGYTLGVRGAYGRENEDRKWRLGYKGELYTAKMAGPAGRTKNSEGKYYLETIETTKLDFDWSTSTEDPSLKVVGRAGLRYDSKKADGPLVKVQNLWHNQGRYQDLRYHQIRKNESELSAEFQAGLQKIFKADVGDFRCMAAGTAMVGVSTVGKPMATLKAEGEISTGVQGGRNQDTPYLLLSHVLNHEYRGSERSQEQRTEIGSYVYAGKEYSVYAGVGRLKLKNPYNTEYTIQRAPNGDEKNYYFRFKAEKRFQGL